MLAPLLPQLAAVARVARRRLLANAFLAYLGHVDTVEYEAYSESAVFLAFVALGGDYEHPDAFDFLGRRRELLRRTEAELRGMLRSDDQNFQEERNRERDRPEGVDETCWDAWRDGIGQGELLVSGTPPANRFLGHTPQDTELQAAALHGLRAELARILNAADRDVITRHYLDEVPQCEIAVERDVTSNVINVQLHRARTRLRAVLPAHWHDMLGSG